MVARVLVVGDSVSMPSSGVDYEDTWLFQLVDHYPQVEFINRTEGGSTTKRLDDKFSLESYDPDAVLTQLGIVDCAPRITNRFDRRFVLDVLPKKMENAYMKIVKKFRTRRPDRARVNPDEFRENIADFYHRANSMDVTVLCIAIAPAYPELIDKSPYIADSIARYNAIYRECVANYPDVEIVDPFSDVQETAALYKTGVHLNEWGHEVVFESLVDRLGPYVDIDSRPVSTRK